MLVLTRKIGQSIVINDNIRVVIVAIHGNKVRIAVEAPREVAVDREEIYARRQEFAEIEMDAVEV